MSPILLALAATILFSSTFVWARRGVLYCDILLGTLIASWINFLILTAWVAATAPLSAFADKRILMFFGLGLFVPSLSRLLLLAAVEKVGASRTSSLRAMSPFLASLMAVLFLGERPTLWNVIGMTVIIAGGMILSKPGRKERVWRRRDLIYPLAGTVLLGFRDVVTRYGVADHPHPVVGAWAMLLTSGVVISGIWLRRRPGGEGFPPLRGWIYFGLVGGSWELASCSGFSPSRRAGSSPCPPFRGPPPCSPSCSAPSSCGTWKG